MKYIRYIIVLSLLTIILFASETPYCLNFKDHDDYVYIDDEPLEFTTRFTLECWFNLDEFVDSSALIDFSTYNLHEEYAFGYGIYVMDSSRISVKMGNFSKTFEMIIDSLKTDIWYHLAVTYDKYKNDENIVALLNGQVVKKADCDIYLEYPETFRPYGVMLGAYYDYPFLKAIKGQMDDVRFWSDIRTNEEIKYYMDREIDEDAQGLVGYYSFNQLPDSLLFDQSVNENHGKLENMTDSSWQLSYAQLAAEPATDISFDRMVITWTSSHDFTSYCVDLSPDKDFTSSHTGFPVTDISTNYYIIDDIDPGTYFYRVKGHYDGQTLEEEPWSNTLIVSTMSDASTPIKLSDFFAEQNGSKIKINWVTHSQTENATFVLERKSGDRDWEKIFETDGAGTQTGIMSYSYLDVSLIPGKTYRYRLKDISFSGKISISREIETFVDPMQIESIDEFELISIYPNPFNPETTIKFKLLKYSNVSMKIFSIYGDELGVLCNDYLEPGTYSYSWAPRHLATGIYFIRIAYDNNTVSHKLLYMK